MRRVEDLSREELEIIVRGTQQTLWEREHNETGQLCWDPDAAWSADEVEVIAGILEAFSLAPDEGEPKLFVNVYLEDRTYGGPEEGGWWYDTGKVHLSTEVPDIEEARRQANTLAAWCLNVNSVRRGVDSVLSEGHYVCRIEHAPAVDYPAQRPVYS